MWVTQCRGLVTGFMGVHAAGGERFQLSLLCERTITIFSNKNMTTAEGGMVVSSDPKIADRVRLLRSHGMTSMSYDRARGHATEYDILELGYNYRLDDIRAALGLAQLAKMPDDIAKRLQLRQRYEQALAEVAEVSIPFAGGSNEMRSNYILVIRLNSVDRSRRDAVRASLAREGVQTSMHYPPLHQFKIFGTDNNVDLPHTERAGDSLITLPFFKAMGDDQVAHVAGALRTALCARS